MSTEDAEGGTETDSRAEGGLSAPAGAGGRGAADKDKGTHGHRSQRGDCGAGGVEEGTREINGDENKIKH